MKKIAALFILLLIGSVSADVTIMQSETLAGKFSGTEGKVIQTHFLFEPALKPGDKFEIYVANKKTLESNEIAMERIVRFTTRLKVNPGETIVIRTDQGGVVTENSFTPKVTKPYEKLATSKYNPLVKSIVAGASISNTYDISIGDCAILVLNVDSSEDSYLKKLRIETNFGGVSIYGGSALSANPFFSIGRGGKFEQCNASVE